MLHMHAQQANTCQDNENRKKGILTKDPKIQEGQDTRSLSVDKLVKLNYNLKEITTN